MKENNTITLETDRLILRKFKTSDYSDMYNNWANDINVAIPSGFPLHKDIDTTKKVINYWINEYNNINVFNWIIIEKESSVGIGSITVVNKDIINKTCEIGYNIGKKWWNCGYATEAIKKVICYLFTTNLFNLITAKCHYYNIASRKVLEKNGFKQDAILRYRIIINKKPISLIEYSITKKEYLKHIENIKLIKNNAWLRITTTIEDYVEPNYYNKLLKEYIFDKKTDLKIFEDEIKKNLNSKKILELGCGSGRASKIMLDNIKNAEYDLLDLSSKMIKYTENRFNDKKINFIQSDTINYLYETKKEYDFVFSLWSYSHSVHQQMHKYGVSDGSKYVKNAIKKFIICNLKSNGKFFIIHFDSLSDEQKILMKQWKRIYKTFNCITKQSPSLIATRQILNELKMNNIIKYEEKHYVGEPIKYKNIDEALEIFLNFHMESYFNETEELYEVYNDVKKGLNKYLNQDGSISIKPGCFIYIIEKK